MFVRELVTAYLLPSAGLFLRLAWRALRPWGAHAPTPHRLAVMVAFLPALTLLLALHWLGHLLDEVLFRGYRRVRVRAPLFVVGPPRSGTTLLHHTLAADSARFTTPRTWEVLLAPSVSARRLALALAAADRRCGRPLGRLAGRAERALARRLGGVHPTGIGAPEEDYLALAPVLGCFALVFAFPHDESLWRLARFDDEVGERERTRILSFYRLCIQKHLYVHGPERRFLSKNASFSGAVRSLRRLFPDCQVLCCLRDPQESVPSLLSAVAPGVRWFALGAEAERFRARLAGVMAHYYRHLVLELGALPEHRCVFVDMRALQADLPATVARAYAGLRMAPEPPFTAYLAAAAPAARAHRPRGDYSLGEFGLDRGWVRERFGAFYAWREEARVAGRVRPPLPELAGAR